MRVADLNEYHHHIERPVASPRVARLRDLEEAPPAWLRSAIGTCPFRSKSDGGTILAWRRAALAIDDYRVAHGYESRDNAIGDPPSNGGQLRTCQRVEREIARVGEERSRRKNGRER